MERDSGQQGGQGGAGHGQHIRWHPLIERHAGGHHLQVIAEPAGEQGAQRPIDQASNQRGALGRAGFTTHEAAGDATGGIEPLFVVAGEGEKINALPRIRSGGGDQHSRVSTLNHQIGRAHV